MMTGSTRGAQLFTYVWHGFHFLYWGEKYKDRWIDGFLAVPLGLQRLHGGRFVWRNTTKLCWNINGLERKNLTASGDPLMYSLPQGEMW